MTTTEQQKTTDDRQPGGPEDVSSEETELDSLLREYDDHKKEPSKPAETPLKDIEPIVRFAKEEMNRRSAESLEKEIDKAVAFIQEPDELKNLKRPMIRGFMEAYALENKGFAKAFAEREANPEVWSAALEKGRDWLVGQMKDLTGNHARDDLAAAEAAVKGQSEGKSLESDDPTNAELLAMTPQEWRKFLSEKFA